jgi:hypothetical protein
MPDDGKSPKSSNTPYCLAVINIFKYLDEMEEVILDSLFTVAQ